MRKAARIVSTFLEHRVPQFLNHVNVLNNAHWDGTTSAHDNALDWISILLTERRTPRVHTAQIGLGCVDYRVGSGEETWHLPSSYSYR